MNDKDRIRLAEAMGWRLQKVDDAPLFGLAVGTQRWVNPAGSICIDVVDLPFNPFTDANDDYAVLEWIRTRVDDPRKDIMRSMMRNMVTNTIKPIKYQVGDYARVALQVLGND